MFFVIWEISSIYLSTSSLLFCFKAFIITLEALIPDNMAKYIPSPVIGSTNPAASPTNNKFFNLLIGFFIYSPNGNIAPLKFLLS